MSLVLLAFGVSTLVSFALTPLTGRLATRIGVIDHPSQSPTGHKRHRTPTPYLGGVAIFVGLLAGSALVLSTDGIPIRHFAMVITAGLGIGLIGLVDDVTPLPRSLRLVAQIAVAFVAWRYGFGVSAVGEPLGLSFTILWIVGITNAFNLLDNMDGACAGLAAIASATFTIMAVINDLPLLPIVAASVTGASIGFLVHNRHPAKVFMGDAGSLFLGFLVALIGLRLRFDNPEETTFLVPVVVLGIPLLDTTLVVLSRLRSGRPVFLGARDHIAHRLVGIGLSTTSAVALMYGAAASLGLLGLAISVSSQRIAFVLLGLTFGAGFVGALLLLRVPVEQARIPADLAPTTHLDDQVIDQPIIDGVQTDALGSTPAHRPQLKEPS